MIGIHKGPRIWTTTQVCSRREEHVRLHPRVARAAARPARNFTGESPTSSSGGFRV